jgi:hypothetical protein
MQRIWVRVVLAERKITVKHTITFEKLFRVVPGNSRDFMSP